jgi:hypothetical protein
VLNEAAESGSAIVVAKINTRFVNIFKQNGQMTG